MPKFKAERAVVLLSLLALIFAAGYYFGRSTMTVLLASAGESAAVVSTQRAAPETADSEDFRLDLNSATVEQLTELSGIGEALAERIVEYRNENGAFTSVDELTKVSGIGDGKLNAIRDQIKVGE